MRIRKLSALILVLIILCNTFELQVYATTVTDYVVEYNVRRKRIEFSYGEVRVAHPSLDSNTSTKEYQWSGSLSGNLVMKNNTNVYRRYCINGCLCYTIVDGVIVYDNCTLPTCACTEKIMVWDKNVRAFTELPTDTHDYRYSIANFTSSGSWLSVEPHIHADLRRSSLVNGENNTGTIAIDTSHVISRPFEVTTRSSHTVTPTPGPNPSPGVSPTPAVPITEYRWSSWAYGGVKTSSFNITTNKLSDSKTVYLKTYDGMTSLPVPTTPPFQNEIEENQSRSPIKNIWWASTKLPVDVVRMTYNETSGGLGAKSGRLTDQRRETRPFQRLFYEQNKAELEWGVKDGLSMRNAYGPDRLKAQNRNYNIDSAQMAVFASDISYGSILFPVNSGYFINPTGTYTFTLTTEMYKRTDEPTDEHTHLVNRLLRSFRYETNLVYINPRTRQPVGIDNAPERVTMSGNAYTIQSAFVHFVGSDTQIEQPVFLSGNELVQLKSEREYTLVEVEQLHQAPIPGGSQHNYPAQNIDAPGLDNIIGSGYSCDISPDVVDLRFQRILEGYNASNTKSSREVERYTEYVHRDFPIFKITETTEVVITVNPNNRKLFTHAMMVNGNHFIRALSVDINLAHLIMGDEYQLNNLVAASPITGRLSGYVMEILPIGVVGSIFDDIR